MLELMLYINPVQSFALGFSSFIGDKKLSWYLPFEHVILFDTETTDARLARSLGIQPEIIEIAAVKLNSRLEIEDEYQALVKPLIMDNVTIYSQDINAITPEILQDQPLWKDQWRKFADFTGYTACPLLSFGTSFDVPVLQAAYSRAKTGYPHSFKTFDVPTLVFARTVRTGMEVAGWSLDSLCKLFSIERQESHRAMPDVLDTLKILTRLSDLDD